MKTPQPKQLVPSITCPMCHQIMMTKSGFMLHLHKTHKTTTEQDTNIKTQLNFNTISTISDKKLKENREKHVLKNMVLLLHGLHLKLKIQLKMY